MANSGFHTLFKKRAKKFLSNFEGKELEKLYIINAAKGWSAYYRAKVYVTRFLYRKWLISALTVIFGLVWASYFWLSELQKFLHLNVNVEVAQNYFVGIGAALLGAGAIAFSFIMFASQINIERMPHHLFWKLSFDKRIVSSFIAIFVMSLVIASFSLIADASNLPLLLLNMFWLFVLTLTLVIFAYRRTIDLISPIKQLALIMEMTRDDMATWARAAQRLMPLLKMDGKSEAAFEEHDVRLLSFFRLHPSWTSQLKQSIDLCRSYIHRYSEYGDYVVTKHAFLVLSDANDAYIKTKGKTFFATNPFYDVPLTTDEVINHTLEEVRQILSVALSKRDERLAEQCLGCLSVLAARYLEINYCKGEGENKSHATLAGAYLRGGLEKIVSHDLTDVGMHGTRLLGGLTQLIAVHASPLESVAFVNDMAKITKIAFAKPENRPISEEGVRQLAAQTLSYIKSPSRDVDYALKEIRREITNVALLFLSVPDRQFADLHGGFLAPYYSSTEFNSLPAALTNLINSIINNAKADNEDAQLIIDHFAEWTDQMYIGEKEVLLKAVKTNSHFTFHSMKWIEHISKLCLLLTTAEACPEYLKSKLEKNATWLMGLYTWLPDDKATVTFVQGYQIQENIFEVAFLAGQTKSWDVLDDLFDQMLNWTIKAGKYHTGWDVFEKGMFAITTLVTAFEKNVAFKTDPLKRVRAALNETKAYEKERRDRLIKSLKARISSLGSSRANYHSNIEYAMASQDENRVKQILESIVSQLIYEENLAKARKVQ